MSNKNKPLQVYEFQRPNEEKGYCLFPDTLENNPKIFFHGTSESVLQSILDKGLQAPATLNSVSLATSSSPALGYACSKRSNVPPNGVVIAVSFEAIGIDHLRCEGDVSYMDDLSQQPLIVGYCIVPEEYAHV